MKENVTVYFDFWKSMVSWVNLYLKRLNEDDLKTEIIPGGNHGVWILGHLIASEDDLSEYLGKGPLLFPAYQDLFKQKSDLQAVEKYPEIHVLKTHWDAVCEKNENIYLELTDKELLEPHEKIEGKIEDDYFKTKAGCLKNWTLHQMHHAGQLAVLCAKCGKQGLL